MHPTDAADDQRAEEQRLRGLLWDADPAVAAAAFEALTALHGPQGARVDLTPAQGHERATAPYARSAGACCGGGRR